MSDPVSAPLLRYLVERAISWTGFRADAILPIALTSLGHVLLHLGRFPKATAVFEASNRQWDGQHISNDEFLAEIAKGPAT